MTAPPLARPSAKPESASNLATTQPGSRTPRTVTRQPQPSLPAPRQRLTGLGTSLDEIRYGTTDGICNTLERSGVWHRCRSLSGSPADRRGGRRWTQRHVDGLDAASLLTGPRVRSRWLLTR